MKIGPRRVKIFLSAFLIFEVLLNILMFNGLRCLIFQKFQPVEGTVAYKTLLIKHNKCRPNNQPSPAA